MAQSSSARSSSKSSPLLSPDPSEKYFYPPEAGDLWRPAPPPDVQARQAEVMQRVSNAVVTPLTTLHTDHKSISSVQPDLLQTALPTGWKALQQALKARVERVNKERSQGVFDGLSPNFVWECFSQLYALIENKNSTLTSLSIAEFFTLLRSGMEPTEVTVQQLRGSGFRHPIQCEDMVKVYCRLAQRSLLPQNIENLIAVLQLALFYKTSEDRRQQSDPLVEKCADATAGLAAAVALQHAVAVPPVALVALIAKLYRFGGDASQIPKTPLAELTVRLSHKPGPLSPAEHTQIWKEFAEQIEHSQFYENELAPFFNALAQRVDADKSRMEIDKEVRALRLLWDIEEHLGLDPDPRRTAAMDALAKKINFSVIDNSKFPEEYFQFLVRLETRAGIELPDHKALVAPPQRAAKAIAPSYANILRALEANLEHRTILKKNHTRLWKDVTAAFDQNHTVSILKLFLRTLRDALMPDISSIVGNISAAQDAIAVLQKITQRLLDEKEELPKDTLRQILVGGSFDELLTSPEANQLTPDETNFLLNFLSEAPSCNTKK